MTAVLVRTKVSKRLEEVAALRRAAAEAAAGPPDARPADPPTTRPRVRFLPLRSVAETEMAFL